MSAFFCRAAQVKANFYVSFLEWLKDGDYE